MAIDALAPTAPVAAVRPVPASEAPSGAASFAELLGQRREACQAAAAPAESTDEPAEATTAPTEPHAAPSKGARRAERVPQAQRSARAAVEPPLAAEAETKAEPAEKDAATPPTDPALPPWLMALHAAPAAVTASDGGPAMPEPKADGAAATASLAAPTGGTATQPAATPDAKPDPKADNVAGARPEPLRLDAGTSAHAREAASALSATEPGPERRTERSEHAVPTEPATVLLPTAAPQRLAEPAPTPAPLATLAAPIDSPEFGAALGVQVSVFAREGVHEAELQLNPTEMGPVSVQIALDGTQARVHFGAEVAATRQAIEASLPELAAALRDAGFTLSGGGISQQRSGRGSPGGDGAAGTGRRVAGASAEQPVTLRAAPRRVALGGVDLYA